MKSIWDGAISFGLVSIPVELYSAEKGNELSFKLIDCRDEHGIKYQRINEATGKEVPWEHIGKAYEFDNGDYVVMTDEDFERADIMAVKQISIEAFINRDELDLIYLEKPYYIVPEKTGEKPYVLLREAMRKTNRIAIARVVLRTKGYLAAIYPLEDALVMNLIRYYDEVRPVKDLEVPHAADISSKEMKLAESLIYGMVDDWKPEEYRDQYKDAVMKRIEAKAVKTPEEIEAEDKKAMQPKRSDKVIDIMDLLKQSVESRPPKTASVEAKGTPAGRKAASGKPKATTRKAKAAPRKSDEARKAGA